MSAEPELVIFDCDGVLVDSEAISNGVLARLLAEEGVHLTLAQARREFQGLLLEEIVARTRERFGVRLPARFLDRFQAERAEEFRRRLRPVPGASELIERVQAASIPVCVASQGRLEKTRMTLRLTGLDRLIPGDAVFSAHSVGRGKPHPDLFLHAAARMGARPARCAVVEDTPSGVRAGIAARMRVLGFSADTDADALQRAGAEVFESLDQVPELLGLER